jgi:hypothetical protein
VKVRRAVEPKPCVFYVVIFERLFIFAPYSQRTPGVIPQTYDVTVAGIICVFVSRGPLIFINDD